MDAMPSHSNASPRPARIRFRFTLTDLLLFAGLCGLALALVEPLIARGFGTPPQDRSNAVVLVLILTAAGAFIGVWRSRVKSEKAESSAVEVVAYVAIAWVWSFAIYRWGLIEAGIIAFVATPGFALAWWLSSRLDLRGEWHVAVLIMSQVVAGCPALGFVHLIDCSISRRSCTVALESCAIAACKTYAEAQDIYRRSDYDGDGILEYAQSGSGDYSLYEVHAGQGDLTLIDGAMAQAFSGQKPKCGYYFKILFAQGSSAPCGSTSYLVGRADGQVDMRKGYALVSWPAEYDRNGAATFIINHHGTVYQKDLGPNTANLVATMTEFNPDSTWVVSE